MAIPNTELFESFISKSQVIERPMGPAVLFSAGLGRPTLYLEYPSLDLTLDSVLRVISRDLSEHGCAANQAIAVTVLGTIAATRPDNVLAVDHANRCLEKSHSCELQQYLVLPSTSRRDYEAVFGEIRLRPFDPERLIYWSRRGGSSYPVDLGQLAGRTTLERDRFSTSLVDWDKVPPDCWQAANARSNHLPVALQDAYYSAVFECHLGEIPGLLRRNLLVLEAGGLVHFDVESIFTALFAQRVGLFHWRALDGRQRTWAVLSSIGGLNLNLVPPRVLGESRRWLEQALGFSQLDLSRPIDRTLNTFCALLQRAHQHRLNGRGDEAALHFVIALDLVLGSESRSAETVAERTAVITHRPFGRSLQEQVKQIKQLYDARSKYVHEGRSIPPGDVSEAERVAMEVLWALLSVSGQGTLSSTAEWLAKINYVSAAMKDSRAIPEDEFVALGVASIDASRVPPNRVLEDPYEVMWDPDARGIVNIGRPR